jgi:hypothetical protein
MVSPRQRRSLNIIPLLMLLLLVLAGAAGWRWQAWSRAINLMLPEDSRPVRMTFTIEEHDRDSFELIARSLDLEFRRNFDHVDRFREAGIRSYRGPETCLVCHREIEFVNTYGLPRREDLMKNLTGSVHYRLFSTDHKNVRGFSGRSADGLPMGMIDRPCPKPGSFAMTAWAEWVVNTRGDTLSEGCGQCHIGGQAQAPLGEIMPYYRTLPEERDAIDCLICHAAAYDLNRRQVVRDANGRLRWDQDRSLRAALSVEAPSSQSCLRCHQHNLGGDLYVDPKDPSFTPSPRARGDRYPRVMHPGSKRGTPFSPTWDVHAAAGLACLDCHPTEGHRIAKGTHTTTMMANDLPDVEVACERCHTDAPHEDSTRIARILNEHGTWIACVTCHIPSLHPDNVTRRDFSRTVLETQQGIHIYDDVEKLTGPGEGLAYVWWNGDATFLGNPIGDNPEGSWRAYTAPHRWPEWEDYDYDAWYERVMRPLAAAGHPSKLYAMKRFNGRQHIDLQNAGPFGGMFVPYNLPLYYRDGDPDAAARTEMEKPMMRMMYGRMFQIYLMNRFISYMDVPGWNTQAYEDVRAGRQVEPRWLPQDAMLEVSHGVRLKGALSCKDCHAPDGSMASFLP